MKILTNHELAKVAGGFIRVGGDDGDSGGGNGGGSGSGGSDGVTEQELDNAFEGIATLVEEGSLGTGVTGMLFSDYHWASLSASVAEDQVQYAENTCQQYLNGGDIAMEHQVAQDQLVHWYNVDFSVYTHGGTLTCKEAVQNLFHDLNTNHHFALNPYSPDLSSTNDDSGNSGGGGDNDQSAGWIYQEEADNGVGEALWLEATTYVPQGNTSVGELHEIDHDIFEIMWDQAVDSF